MRAGHSASSCGGWWRTRVATGRGRFRDPAAGAAGTFAGSGCDCSSRSASAEYNSRSNAYFPRRRPASRQAAFGRELGLALFMGLSGALFFSILTDGGKQTRAVATFLPGGRRDPLLDRSAHRAGEPQWPAFHARCRRVRGHRIPNYRLARDLRRRASASADRETAVGVDGRHQPHLPRLARRAHHRAPVRLRCGSTTVASISSTARAAVLSALKKGTNVRLPRLSGSGAPEQAQSLLDLIVRFPRISERFEMAERVGGRRWTLHLKDRVVVHLGADREAVAFAALSSPRSSANCSIPRRHHRSAHASASPCASLRRARLQPAQQS